MCGKDLYVQWHLTFEQTLFDKKSQSFLEYKAKIWKSVE